MTLPPTCLIFSPHLDDAVFSCGGWIQQKVAEGWRVVVATVFSEGAPEHAARRAEDAAALAYLGAEPLWLGFLDAPWRDPFYTGFEQLILGRSPGDDADFDGLLARSLQAVVDELQPTQFLAPLGVGTHVDHRLVFEAARRLVLPPGSERRFYEERPYGYADGLTELRLRQLGFATEPVDETMLLTAFRELPYVERYLPAGPQRARCERLMLEQTVHPDPCRPVAETRLECILSQVLGTKKAVTLYASQLRDFFGSSILMVVSDRSHARRLASEARRVERLWDLSPALDAHAVFQKEGLVEQAGATG